MRTLAAGLLVLVICSVSTAESPRALPEGQKPDDVRLQPPKDLNGYFPMIVPKSREAWEKRAERVRRQVLVANGLWPMPERTPPNAVIHGKVDREGYTVERVFFESYPGHYVTGNLYRPKGKQGKLPGVLCTHGHFNEGRFHDNGEKGAASELKDDGELSMAAARHPLQARCVQLVRLGCVVFHYDMIGYADSVQISFAVAHRYSKHRPELETAENWGLFSPQAELHMQSIMGLQTYNSVRAIDWLSELPDVDPKRLGVTGESGGGTQTFLLSAVDSRLAVAWPAVMVSTAMQGGCTCENCSYLRIGTGNIELAGLTAPRPLGMSSANDWTKDMETKGMPELKQLYELLGVPEKVTGKSLLQFGHQFNSPSRALMNDWFNKHLKLGFDKVPHDQDFKPLGVAEMTVWNGEHKKPSNGPEYERKLLRTITEINQKQLAALQPRDKKSLAEFRRVVGGAWDVLLGRGLPAAGEIKAKDEQTKDQGGYSQTTARLVNAAQHEETPAVILKPKEWNGSTVLVVSGRGKAGLFDDQGAPTAAVKSLLDAGLQVAGIDVFGIGELAADGKPLEKNARVKGDRDYAGFTYGYNYPVFAKRVHDVLAAIGYLRAAKGSDGKLHLVGIDGGGAWAAAAHAQSGEAVGRFAVDTRGFRFANVTEFDHPDFQPGAAKYGDLPGLLALSAGKPVWLAGEEKLPAALRDAWAAAGETLLKFRSTDGKEDVTGEMVTWLLTQ